MDYNLKKIYQNFKSTNTKPKSNLVDLYIEQIKKPTGGGDYSIYSKPPAGGKYEYMGDVEVGDLPKVKKLINAGRGKHEIVPYLNSKNYSDKTFKNPNSFVGLVEMLSSDEWINFVTIKEKPLIVKNRVGNIGEIASKYGVEYSSVRTLADFQATDAGGSNIGPGEILLSVVFGDVANSTSGGDLINVSTGSKIEVKGQGGRFGQQGGRSSQGVAFDILNAQLQNKITGIEQNMSIPLVLVVFHGAFKREGKEQLFLPAVEKFLQTIYPKADYSSIFTSPAIFGNKNDARRAVEKIYVSNYINKYDFEEILFIDKIDLKYAMFTPDQLLSKNGLIDSGTVKINSIRFNDPYTTIFYKF